MNVKQLRKKLSALPDDMEVIVEVHSDYGVAGGAAVLDAVDQGYYVMRKHDTMSQQNVAKLKKYLLLAPDVDHEVEYYGAEEV